MKKKVVVQLPPVAKEAPVTTRYALELEALDSVAEIVEVDGTSTEAFIEGAKDADAIMTSWGIHIDETIINALEQCVVIGVGSVGVDVGYISYEYIDSTPDATFDETYLGLSFGDFGVSFAFGDYDYTEVSYALGDVSFSYGDYDGYGSNFLISYGFSCGSYDCGLAYSDFSGDTDAAGDFLYGPDEDALVFSVSASL